MNHLLQKSLKEIKKAKKILLVTHFNPDGDAVASICAMIEYLESLGKEYLAFCHSPVPDNYNFVPHGKKIRNSADLNMTDNGLWDSFDLILVFDCANQDRTALAGWLNKRPISQKVIEFDHHPKSRSYADIEICDPSASSTAEIVYSFFKVNGVKINRTMASCILTGIITDTGAFLYPSTSPKTIKIGSEMILNGASHSRIVDKSLKNKNLSTLKTWGNVLDNLVINKKYGLAIAVLTYDEYRRQQVAEEEYEGLSGFLSNLAGVNGVLFLRETEPGKVRGSLRTAIKSMDLSCLAGALGGGGHKNAAGFTLLGQLVTDHQGWRII